MLRADDTRSSRRRLITTAAVMRSLRVSALTRATLFAAPLLLVCAGCSSDPMTDFMGMTIRRSEWAADEEFGMNPHTRLQELEMLADRAGGMEPGEQDRVSNDLAIQLRDERNAMFRARMVRVLGKLKTESARQSLTVAIGDPSPNVRVAACQSWGEQGGPAALDALAQVVGSDTEIDVRMAATRALGNLKDPAAVRPLAIALDDNDPAMQACAMRSMSAVSGQDYGMDVAAWRQFARGEEPQYEAPSVAERLRELF